MICISSRLTQVEELSGRKRMEERQMITGIIVLLLHSALSLLVKHPALATEARTHIWLLLTKTAIPYGRMFTGGADDDLVNCIKETTDGGYIMSGLTYSFSGTMDAYLIKTRSDGYAGIEYNEMPEITINVYPNPCSEILNISASILSESDVTVELVNFQGQKLLNERIIQSSNNHVSLNVSALLSGIYYLSLFSGENQISKKIIIN